LKDTKTSSMLGVVSETSRAVLVGIWEMWSQKSRWNCCWGHTYWVVLWYFYTLETSLCVYTVLSLGAF